MSLKTRIDGRSKDNNLLTICDASGKEIATIKVEGEQSVTLSIGTTESIIIKKPNGWSSGSN